MLELSTSHINFQSVYYNSERTLHVTLTNTSNKSVDFCCFTETGVKLVCLSVYVTSNGLKLRWISLIWKLVNEQHIEIYLHKKDHRSLIIRSQLCFKRIENLVRNDDIQHYGIKHKFLVIVMIAIGNNIYIWWIEGRDSLLINFSKCWSYIWPWLIIIAVVTVRLTIRLYAVIHQFSIKSPPSALLY